MYLCSGSGRYQIIDWNSIKVCIKYRNVDKAPISAHTLKSVLLRGLKGPGAQH
jgi:hypothetical protein